MKRVACLLTTGAAALWLSGCQTTDSDDWNGGERTPFEQAERSCETQTDNISKEEERANFFTGCMRALGWEPKPGTHPNI